MPKHEIDWNIDALTNDHFIPLYENKSRYLILYGGAGSGKSYFAAEKFVLRILKSIKRGYKEKFLFLRKFKRSCRNTVFSLFKHYVYESGLSNECKINKTEMSFEFSNGSEVHCEGMDNPEKIKSYHDVTSIWMEEATEFNDEDFLQADLRPRGINIPSYAQLVLTFNPISKLNWAYKKFFQTENPEITVDRSTFRNNRYLDDAYIAMLERLKEQDEVFYKIYALGEWGVLGNLVFTNWTEKDISLNELDYDEIRCGLDFGFNNPSAFIRIGFRDQDIYILDEFYQTRLTNAELIRELKNQKIIKQDDLVIADSAEPDRIKEFREAEYDVRASQKGKDSVKRGIEWIRQRKIYVHPRNTNTVKELSTCKYKQDKDGNVLEEPVPFNDHLISAMRYSVEDYVLHDYEDVESLGVAFA